MRIVQISGALMGAQKLVQEAIHRYAVQQGHDSYIFYARGFAADDMREICYEKNVENIITRGLRKYLFKDPMFSRLQTMRLISYIKQRKPDVVHLHVIHNGYTDYQLLLSKLAHMNVPIVFTMHDMWAFTGGCYHYTVEKCKGFERGCSECPAKSENLDIRKSRVQSALITKTKLFEKLSKLEIVTVSEWVKQETEKSFLKHFPIRVIPNGVEIEASKIDVTSLGAWEDNKKHLLGVAAAWSMSKGIDIVFQIATLLGEGYVIDLIGNVSDKIRAMAPPNIHFHGYCTDKCVLSSYFQNADLYFSASLEETYGMTFVEAALAGTRSVGFRSTAITETLEIVHGICVREFSATAMSKAIMDAIAGGNGKLTQEEIAQISDSVSITKMASSYLRLYQELLYDN